MKVLVTGGAGVIGSRVTEDLLARGDSVLVFDNFETGRRDSVPESPQVTLVEGTITNQERVIEVFETFRPEVVVHCAASYKDPEAWNDDVSTNVLGTINVVRAFQRAGCRRLIYLQTALCYGLSPSQQPVPIDYPLVPEGSSYAYSKTVAEQYIRLSGIDYVTFRLANVYGPRTLTGPMPVFYDRLVNDKPCFVVDTRRDWVFVGDLAELVLLAIDGKGERGAYHGASGTDYAIKDLYDATRAALDLPPDPDIEIRERGPGDAYTLLLDPSKTERDFGWQATTPFEEGIGYLVDWYRTHAPKHFYTHLKLDDAE